MITWIKGGKVVDPVKGVVELRDLLVENGKIVKILPPGKFEDTNDNLKTVDAYNRIIVPGLVDIHTHLREPGHEYKETILSGARAAVVGASPLSPVCRTHCRQTTAGR